KRLIGRCAIKTSGALFCWDSSAGPQEIPSLGGVIDYDAAGAHCAVKADRTLWCWGSNAKGEIGDGTAIDKPSPEQAIKVATDVPRVSTGSEHTCALKSDKTLWCWGDNERGAIGDGTQIERHTPAQVEALGAEVVGMSAGKGRTCAMKGDGTLWCW